MSDAGEWGPWVEHDGSGCPVPPGVWIEVFAVGPNLGTLKDEDWSDAFVPEAWDVGFFGVVDSDGATFATILRYRVRRPKALRDLIDLVEKLPTPAVPERVEA